MKLYTSYLEISKSALAHNIDFLKELIGPEVIFSSVVKGNAYGHGIETYIPLAQECGIRHFSVFSSIEASRVRKSLVSTAEIVIMGWIGNDDLEWAILHDIQFYIFERDRLEKAIHFAKKCNKRAKIHLEIETGMNRTGLSRDELEKVIVLLKENANHIELKGLCTHFAGAENISNFFRIKEQRKEFKKARKMLKDAGLKAEIIHAACSAAALRYPNTRHDMVRLGIVQYGFFPNKEVLIEYLTKNALTRDPLQRLLSWKSKVMDVKHVGSGKFVGYGTSFMAETDMKIATVPVGYSDGFSRALSNQGRVLIGGKRLNVIGIVNMNMMMVDVSSLPEVHKGDEVVMIGRQGENEISVSSFSEFSHLVDYELLTRIPDNIPRYIVD